MYKLCKECKKGYKTKNVKPAASDPWGHHGNHTFVSLLESTQNRQRGTVEIKPQTVTELKL